MKPKTRTFRGCSVRVALTMIMLVGCGPDETNSTCEGIECGAGPRIKLTAQDGFGILDCQGEATNCRVDFGVLQVGRAAESWTNLENAGDSTLRLSELAVTDPVFEVSHPAIELEPGERISFRLRVRLDSPGLERQAQLFLDSDAVNGTSASSGCAADVTSCSRVTINLSARTDS